jgi:hypothetical protein
MSGSDVDTRLPKHRLNTHTETVSGKVGWNCILVLDGS